MRIVHDSDNENERGHGERPRRKQDCMDVQDVVREPTMGCRSSEAREEMITRDGVRAEDDRRVNHHRTCRQGTSNTSKHM